MVAIMEGFLHFGLLQRGEFDVELFLSRNYPHNVSDSKPGISMGTWTGITYQAPDTRLLGSIPTFQDVG